MTAILDAPVIRATTTSAPMPLLKRRAATIKPLAPKKYFSDVTAELEPVESEWQIVRGEWNRTIQTRPLDQFISYRNASPEGQKTEREFEAERQVDLDRYKERLISLSLKACEIRNRRANELAEIVRSESVKVEAAERKVFADYKVDYAPSALVMTLRAIADALATPKRINSTETSPMSIAADLLEIQNA